MEPKYIVYFPDCAKTDCEGFMLTKDKQLICDNIVYKEGIHIYDIEDVKDYQPGFMPFLPTVPQWFKIISENQRMLFITLRDLEN